MLKKILLLSLLTLSFSSHLKATESQKACPDVLNYSLNNIKNEKVSLCQYSGKLILVANTASECGFTGQYSGLQKLFEKYKDQGLVVLGFPSNDFGGQEPGSNQEIQGFCKRNYGVSFPLFEKSSVKKSPQNPFFKNLIQKTGKTPSWNFNKYLISQDGKTVWHFGSMTSPLNSKLEKAIQNHLLPKKI